ncbi:MAG TPA: hypothetical protein VFM54_23355 [Micromonosporaceae bacterium]|nr:hypothetical protein [Micromonosporaceae bacterium]
MITYFEPMVDRWSGDTPATPARPRPTRPDLDVLARRRADGRVEIISAPHATRVTLEFLAAADPAVVQVRGCVIHLAGQVAYWVTGWDPACACLLVERVDDAHTGRGQATMVLASPGAS